MGRLTKRHGKHAVQIGGETRRHDEAWLKLAHYEDLEEQGRLIVTPETGIGDLSDGYHTFNELYHHRAILFSVICNFFKSCSWKSKKHSDGTMYDGMFIVGIDTPEGSATYHYDIEPYWNMFDVKELDKAPEWDGHTPDDAINRIAGLGKSNRLIGWRKTAEEKPNSTRHLIVADGEIISHYGYYLKPKDKWFTNWKCEEEISTPIFWADMPEPPKESLHGDCGAKMEVVKND